ncbi:MAG: ATP-binding protein [Oscillospiraceae bacterium]|nr:ATP-binding protein [Oscillospiraceae bacterium]
MKETDKSQKFPETDELMGVILDSTPLVAQFWDENLKVIECNQAAVKMFNLSNKQEYIDRYLELMPEFQPNGQQSFELLKKLIEQTYKEGYQKFEWMRQSLDGEPIPVENILVRVNCNGRDLVVGYCRDLREQKKMLKLQDELAVSAARLKAVVANYPGAICSADRNFRITLFDGLLVPHLINKNLFFEGQDLHVALEKDEFKHILEKLYATFTEGAQDWSFESNGKSLHMTTTPIHDENGEISSLVAKIDDVTKMTNIQKQLETALKQSEDAIRAYEAAQTTTLAMVETNPHMNVLLDDKFQVINCNRAAVKFMGFETKEEFRAGFAGRMANIIPKYQPNGKASLSLARRLAVAVKEGHISFDTSVNMGGIERTLNMELIRIPYGDSFAIVAYVFDMTGIYEQEKKLKSALESAETAVQASKAAQITTSAMFDSNPHMNVLFNSSFKVIDCNPAAIKFFGFDTKENFLAGFIERIVTSIPKVQPDGRTSIPLSERLITAVKEGSAKFETELFMGGVKRNLDVEFKRIPYEGSFAIVGYVYDMTLFRAREMELARLYELNKVQLKELNLALKEAEAANKAKSSFLSTMSHEIRTPMNAILGITEIQLQNDDIDPNIQEAFEKIYASGDLLLGIINDILDLSKIEAGKMELNINKYELSSLISDTAQINMMRIGSKPVEFELEIDENIPLAVTGDELRVKQILNNILSNAFKYTTSGKVKMSVSAERGEDENVITLIYTISDTGQGMTKQQVAKLFEEYSRFNQETNRSTEGTGLGMSITRNLIYLMGGKIFIESELGIGSVFTIHLPQGNAGPDILGKELVENLKNFRTSSRAQMKRVQITRQPMPYGSVLIVDDVETNIYVAKGLLSPYKLKIDSGGSGFAAIEKIKNGNVYDIIFMDHMMPEMDGIEATKIIRGMGYTNSIVALTANAVAGQADIFLKNGFDDFISKPIDVRQLNSVLNKLIRDKQPPEVILQETKDESKSGDFQSDMDPLFVEIFVRDALKALGILEKIEAEKDYANKDTLQSYIINVHGMKSALANIGKMDLSAAALKLEAAAREGLLTMVASDTFAFLKSLRAYVEEIAPRDEAVVASEDEDKAFLREKLLLIKEACEYYDRNTADDELAELRSKSWSQQTGELLGKTSERLLHGDFDEIIDAINAFTDIL